ncbi:LacI family DNA-binding transcriptional regulator [Inquilinus sp. NPDC058860]|uniref:LacI family DNA-binding transcriptional regulator n=1 Tax=Inquilinus sp. NPDC058860 TaxID=3346652 RepID=UPI0036B8ACD8
MDLHPETREAMLAEAPASQDDARRRVTLADVAAAAGVGVATVDRVLNGRRPVREATAERVLTAAERIGYHGAGIIKQRLLAAAQPRRRFGFLLQKSRDAFYQAIGASVVRATAAARQIRGEAAVIHVDELAPVRIADELVRLGGRCDAVACVAVDHPHVTRAVAELAGRGVPVFTLLSDLSAPDRAGYVGLDSRKVGRTGAWLIARTAGRPGQVAVFVGSHRYLGQEMCEIGFRSYFREHGRGFELLETAINLDDPAVAHAFTLELLQRHPDLVGIYDAGGGREGIIRALREENRKGLAVVCNELTDATRAALIDGFVSTVIALPVDEFCSAVVAEMIEATSDGPPAGLRHRVLPFRIYVSENVDPA